jgi:FKBP-type peptidyl-prolyl cis-trans isomerase SlyD
MNNPTLNNLTLVAKDTVVSFHYTLSDKAGQVLDSSQGGQPLVYLHGYSQIVPGLENALLGKAVGPAFKVAVEPSEGYGERNEQMVITLPRTQGNLPADIEVGFVVELVSPEGDEIPARVVKLTEADITLDANHPLAGETLYFEIELTDVRAATKEEIEHGHVHGPGGHHHH